MVVSVGEMRGGLPRTIVHGVVYVLAGILLLVVGGCSTDGGVSVKPAGLSCVDDSAACVSARSSALEALMADKSRTWVRQQPTASAYASGVRLFAFKKRKAELSCDELGIGRREAAAGPQVLRGNAGRGLTPAQISRGVMLAEEVSRELGREMKRKRCRA